MKSTFWVTLVLIFTSLNTFAGKEGVGGFRYSCYSEKVSYHRERAEYKGELMSSELADFWEWRNASVWKLQSKKTESYIEQVNHVLDRLSEIDKVRAEKLRANFKNVEYSEGNAFFGFKENVAIPRVEDANYKVEESYSQGKYCYLIPVAFQQKNVKAGERKVLIDRESFFDPQFSETDRAGLLMHELSYQEDLVHRKPETSDKVREFSFYLFSKRLDYWKTPEGRLDYLRYIVANDLNYYDETILTVFGNKVSFGSNKILANPKKNGERNFVVSLKLEEDGQIEFQKKSFEMKKGDEFYLNEKLEIVGLKSSSIDSLTFDNDSVQLDLRGMTFLEVVPDFGLYKFTSSEPQGNSIRLKFGKKGNEKFIEGSDLRSLDVKLDLKEKKLLTLNGSQGEFKYRTKEYSFKVSGKSFSMSKETNYEEGDVQCSQCELDYENGILSYLYEGENIKLEVEKSVIVNIGKLDVGQEISCRGETIHTDLVGRSTECSGSNLLLNLEDLKYRVQGYVYFKNQAVGINGSIEIGNVKLFSSYNVIYLKHLKGEIVSASTALRGLSGFGVSVDGESYEFESKSSLCRKKQKKFPGPRLGCSSVSITRVKFTLNGTTGVSFFSKDDLYLKVEGHYFKAEKFSLTGDAVDFKLFPTYDTKGLKTEMGKRISKAKYYRAKVRGEKFIALIPIKATDFIEN